jgi:hypothetical protein
MVKNKPNRPLSRLINHFNKDAPPSDTQHLTISREAFAIRFADELICSLHHALTFFETLNFIDELFGSIRVIAKNDHVGFGGGRSPAKVFGFIVVFLRLGEMLIDAGEVFSMAFLRMVPDQNGLIERDHFKSFSGCEMSPGCNVFVLLGKLSKARSFRCAF